MDLELKAQVQSLIGDLGKVEDIQKLFGEASYRIYYRIKLNDGKTLIVMKTPPGIQSASEEITNYQGTKNEPPFLNIQRYLAAHELPVPQVLATDLNNGLILLQDLGDKTFEKLLENCNDGMRLFFYKQAIDLLLKFQKTGEQFHDAECMAFKRSFDLNLLTWEFDHFLEYGIEDRFGIKIPAADKQKMQELGLKMIQPIVEIPYGLTHRDYQSRNLMFYGYDFYLIDFQDALLGPPQYDMVALLRDSYVELPFATVEVLLDTYLAGRKKVGLSEVDSNEFKNNFHRITLQRKLKDAGRFQYIFKMKGNPNFLPHLPTSLRYVKQAFVELPEYHELQGILGKYVKELL